MEFDFDFCDADQMEIYERETRRVVERTQDKAQYAGKSNAESFRIQCHAINDFFDALFGDGTSEMLFHGRDNLREHLAAFEDVAKGAKESGDSLRAITDKYIPNRAERRLVQKQQGKAGRQHGRQQGPGFASASGHTITHPAEYAGPTGDRGEPGVPGPRGIPATGMVPQPSQQPTPEQQAFIEKFIAMMPEMDAFMQSYQKQQGNGVNG